jgi:hypothetical protein
MRIAVLETLVIDHAIGMKLLQAANHVTMGSPTANNESASKQATPLGERTKSATFANAALRSAGAEQLRGRILIHAGNPLIFPKA